MIIDFNRDWDFYREEGEAERVDIPHDAMILEPRSPESPSGSAGAFFPGGKYCYEKSFEVPKEWSDKVITFEFEGVYRKAKVYLNGKLAGGCSYGYSSFWIRAEHLLNYGEINVIRVTADNSEQPNSRWYSGSGIYRPVRLWVQEQCHIEPEGIRITTVSGNPAEILVETAHQGGNITVEILDGGKKITSSGGSPVRIQIPEAVLWSEDEPKLYECNVMLWQEGRLVEKRSEKFGIRTVEWNSQGLFINGKETLLRGGCIHHDHGILGARCYEESERRRVKILKEAGYNALRSAHNPASNALLRACDEYGMYLIDETWDMWYNHKNKHDYASDFMENYQKDIRAMVSRDYNHPCVLMYSIGNEVSEPAKEKGIALEKEMADLLHELDPGRAVTCGFNLMIVAMAASGKGIYKEEGGREDDIDVGGNIEESRDQEAERKKAAEKAAVNSSAMFNEMTSRVGSSMNMAANSQEADKAASPGLDLLDIAGYNYASGRYPLEQEAHPDRIIYGSETFPQDIGKNWEMVKKLPGLIGDFMWTAWDYLGETGIGAWAYTDDGARFDKPYPWLLADTGAFDILGNETAQAGYAAVVWGVRKKPYIGVRPVNHPGAEPAKAVWKGTNAIPSWAWRGCEGNPAVTEVYANAESAELFLNGISLGRQKLEDKKTIFEIQYEPSRLEAVVYDETGKESGRSELRSASGELCISVEPEQTQVKEGTIVYVPVNVADEDGMVESNSDRRLSVTVTGGKLLAFGSASPRTKERYESGSFTTYYGRALAVVSCPEKGCVEVTAASESGEKGSAVIQVI